MKTTGVRWLPALCACAIALLASDMAAAQCAPLPGPLVSHDATEMRYVARYNALVALDPYLHREDLAPDWRALLTQLQRDPTVSVDLVARTEIKLAAALGQADQISDALPVAKHALSLTEMHGLDRSPLHAEMLSQLSLAELDAAKTTDAIIHAEAAVKEATSAFGLRSWQTGRAAVAANAAYFAAGRSIDAEPFARLAEELALSCLPADDPRIITRITSHAAVLGSLGQLSEALAGDERAARWALEHGHEHEYGMIRALDALGWDLRAAGRIREAEGVLRHGVDLAARFQGDNWQLRAQLLGKLADVLQSEGHGREAEALWMAASEYDRKVANLSNPLIGSGELRRAASAAQARGDLPLALARREQAVALITKNAPPGHPELARARIEQATTLASLGRDKEARALADPAIAVVRKSLTPGNFLRVSTEISYAQIVDSSEGGAAAYPIALPIARRMEAMMLDAATSRSDLLRLASVFSSGFATTARLALSIHDDEEAFRQLQLANFSDIVIVNTDIAARAAAGSNAASVTLGRLQKQVLSRQQLDRDRVRAITGSDPAELARLDRALHDINEGIAANSQELDRIYPAFRRLGRPVPVTLADFRARLSANDILIAPIPFANETVTVAVTREGLAWASAPISQVQITALVDRIRGSIAASRQGGSRRFDADAARRLYQAVLPPALTSTLRAHRHLLYFAPGALAKVPPALLIETPARRGMAPAWLIRSHSVSILPTLLPSRRADGTGRGLMGIGAPLLSGAPPHVYERGATPGLSDFGTIAVALPPLPNARRELRSIAAAFPAGDSRLMLGVAATERAMKVLPLDRYRTIAIATHGLVRDALPGLTEPALVLTPPKSPDAIDDGLLTASEIANLHLRADWVILSACDTASGSDPEDATYTGLARAFMEAGAHALLVSHWAVRDDAAERLTVATVRATRRGVDRATALQRAMLGLMHDRSVPDSSNPAIWAPFVLVE